MKDAITGLEGIAIGHCVYITGCNRTLVQPCEDNSSKKLESHWIDDDRLGVMEGKNPIVLEVKTAGFDKAAPRR